MMEIVPDFRACCKHDNLPSYNDLGQDYQIKLPTQTHEEPDFLASVHQCLSEPRFDRQQHYAHSRDSIHCVLPRGAVTIVIGAPRNSPLALSSRSVMGFRRTCACLNKMASTGCVHRSMICANE